MQHKAIIQANYVAIKARQAKATQRKARQGKERQYIVAQNKMRRTKTQVKTRQAGWKEGNVYLVYKEVSQPPFMVGMRFDGSQFHTPIFHCCCCAAVTTINTTTLLPLLLSLLMPLFSLHVSLLVSVQHKPGGCGYRPEKGST